MPTSAQPGVTRRILARFAVLSLAFAVAAVWQLIPRWHEWRAGAPDDYPGQHRGLFFSAVSSLHIAIILPIPLLIARAERGPRVRRLALWAVWAALMTGIVVL